MTTVTIYQDRNGTYTGFDCEGHSGYGDEGNDIVCASVSALVINTVNSIESLTDDPCRSEADEDGAVIRLRLEKGYSRDTDLLIRSMILGLNDIRKSYSAYLQILFEEV